MRAGGLVAGSPIGSRIGSMGAPDLRAESFFVATEAEEEAQGGGRCSSKEFFSPTLPRAANQESPAGTAKGEVKQLGILLKGASPAAVSLVPRPEPSWETSSDTDSEWPRCWIAPIALMTVGGVFQRYQRKKATFDMMVAVWLTTRRLPSLR